jgi:hypothetical protein
MSIQAVAWVLEDENVPGFARLVLISLANHADTKTGHAWPSVATIAKEAHISSRSVHTYLGALKRNGYIDIESGRHKAGQARSNNYWIRFDRSKDPWVFNKKDDDQSAPDSHIEDSDSDITQPLDCERGADIADGISASSVQTNHHYSNHQESFPVEGRKEPSPEARSEPRPVAVVSPPQALAPPGFDPKARQAAFERHQVAEEARSTNRRVPVIEGTKAWEAHVRAGHPRTLVGIILVDGKPRRGWEFRTLFPPKSTGPPLSSLMTEADEAELARGI